MVSCVTVCDVMSSVSGQPIIAANPVNDNMLSFISGVIEGRSMTRNVGRAVVLESPRLAVRTVCPLDEFDAR